MGGSFCNKAEKIKYFNINIYILLLSNVENSKIISFFYQFPELKLELKNLCVYCLKMYTKKCKV